MTLFLEPLTKEAFSPYGDVIEVEGSDWFFINQKTVRRYHKLSLMDIEGEGGHPAISMARGTVVASFPIGIHMLERHPLGSQVFFPCSGSPFIAVVAVNGKDDKPDETSIRAFYVRPNQGVNYRMGTWHHPLICLVPDSDFIIADRVGSGNNCEEVELTHEYKIAAPSSDTLSVKK